MGSAHLLLSHGTSWRSRNHGANPIDMRLSGKCLLSISDLINLQPCGVISLLVPCYRLDMRLRLSMAGRLQMDSGLYIPNRTDQDTALMRGMTTRTMRAQWIQTWMHMSF